MFYTPLLASLITLIAPKMRYISIMMTHKTAIDIPQQIVYIPSNSYHTLHHTLDSCWKMLYSEICCQYSIVRVEYSTAVFQRYRSI